MSALTVSNYLGMLQDNPHDATAYEGLKEAIASKDAARIGESPLRLIELAQLQVDESALTGESVTVAKHAAALPGTGDSALGDRLNMAYKGTTATHGRARGGGEAPLR